MSEQEKNTTGEIDPSIWDEHVAVTGRPNDEPGQNSTFAERAKSRSTVKKVDGAEPQAKVVTAPQSRRSAKKA